MMMSNKQIGVLRSALCQVRALQTISHVDTKITALCIALIDQYLAVEKSSMLVLAENEQFHAQLAALQPTAVLPEEKNA